MGGEPVRISLVRQAISILIFFSFALSPISNAPGLALLGDKSHHTDIVAMGTSSDLSAGERSNAEVHRDNEREIPGVDPCGDTQLGCEDFCKCGINAIVYGIPIDRLNTSHFLDFAELQIFDNNAPPFRPPIS